MTFPTAKPGLAWLVLATSSLLPSIAAACGEGGETDPDTCALLCSNGIDDDGDGYTDDFDVECGKADVPDCTVEADIDPDFALVREGRAGVTIDSRHTLAAADIDADGVVEFVIGRGGNTSELTIISADDYSEEVRIPFAFGAWEVFDSGVAMGQLDPATETLEIAWMSGAGTDFRVNVAAFDGSTWKVTAGGNARTLAPGTDFGANTRGWATSLADIDGDGVAEIITGVLVWRWDASTGDISLLASGLSATGGAHVGNNPSFNGYKAGMTAVMDILPSPGLEIAAGNQVYAFDTSTDPWEVSVVTSPVARQDGFTSVADMDHDGDLDIIVAAKDGLYIWDPNDNAELAHWGDNNGNYVGRPVIGEFWNADLADDGLANESVPNLPDVMYVRSTRLFAYTLSDTADDIWTLTTNDGSGATKPVIYDLNGDGISEIIYRDQSQLRVMYGGPLIDGVTPTQVNTANRDYTRTACASGTRLEGPIILDTDKDGQSEIALTCSNAIEVWGSDSEPWTPSRSIWNQYYYHVTNVDDEGNIPRNPQDITLEFPPGSGRFPLNVGLTQFYPANALTPPGVVAAADFQVELDEFVPVGECGDEGTLVEIRFTITNTGDTQGTGALPVAFYNGDPATGGTLIQVATLGTLLEPGDSRQYAFQIDEPSAPFDLYARINDDGSDPVNGAVPSEYECDVTDNLVIAAEFKCELDSDRDGVGDLLEIAAGWDEFDPDTDGDGLCDGSRDVDDTCVAGEDKNDNGIVDDGETDPNLADTDGGGVSDGVEVLVDLTDPFDPVDDLGADFDGDGIPNEVEVAAGLDPTNPDTDGDGLCDGTGTPSDSSCEGGDAGEDQNNDGVIDAGETDPNDDDSDDDNLLDGIEVLGDTDPLDPDTDGDGLCDGTGSPEEASCDGGELGEDQNDDGVVDSNETDPNNADTDEDGIDDGIEVGVDGLQPLNPDSDGDGLCDGAGSPEGDVCAGGSDGEDQNGDGIVDDGETDPTKADTDGGGVDDGTEVITDGTDPLVPSDDVGEDFDGDGVTNDQELNDGTDPTSSDTDGDGISDGVEGQVDGLDPLDPDSDGDGLCDGIGEPDDSDCLGGDDGEDQNGDGIVDDGETDPTNDDTDGDRLSDGEEVIDHETDPLDADTDDGGRTDGDEVLDDLTDPLDGSDDLDDSDGDGLSDPAEALLGTDPNVADTDGDGLNDGVEVNDTNTDPLLADTDDDGLDDGAEVNDTGTDPNLADTDGDGLDDGTEINDTDTDPLVADTDGDGLDDGTEVNTTNTDPNLADSDDDGLDDGTEVNDTDTDPNNADSDGDGLSDGNEVNEVLSDPNLADTDGGGVDDGTEVSRGTDPLNADDDASVYYAGGCATSGTPAGWWLLGGLALLLRRRREGGAL